MRIFLFLFFVSYGLSAQKIINSKVIYSANPIENNVASDNYKIEYTRKLEIKSDDKFNITLKRIRQKSVSISGNVMNVDTENPFPNNKQEKAMIEHYNSYIDQTVKLDLSKAKEKTTVNKLWCAGLPVLNHIEEFSGILLNRRESNWVDTLLSGDYQYINSYETTEKGEIILKGESRLTNEPKVKANTTEKVEVPPVGTELKAKTIGNRQQYELTIYPVQDTKLIRKLAGKLTKSEVFEIMGQEHYRSTTEYVFLENEFID